MQTVEMAQLCFPVEDEVPEASIVHMEGEPLMKLSNFLLFLRTTSIPLGVKECITLHDGCYNEGSREPRKCLTL